MKSLAANTPPPEVSVVIPVHNRGALIRWTLESVRRAADGLHVEIIVIDDGSTIPLADELRDTDVGAVAIHRQDNRGLLFARLAGLERASGRYVLFLDSDDLLHPEKLSRQLAAMHALDADVSYSDEAAVPLDEHWASAPPSHLVERPAVADPIELFIRQQPAPHNPLFRSAYLRPLVEHAWLPPSPRFNSVAEIWFYLLCAAVPSTRIAKVDAPLTLQGLHPGPRISGHWEKLALGSLAVMEGCAARAPATPDFLLLRRAVAERAFLAWRALPHDTPSEYQDRLLAVCAALPAPPLHRLGGLGFRLLARLLGRRFAARLLRRRQRPAYDAIRTLPPGEFARLAAEHDRPPVPLAAHSRNPSAPPLHEPRR